MRVLHVTPYFAPAWRYGGPVQSVLRLCQSLQAAGVDVTVATTNSDGAGDLDVPLDCETRFDGVPVHYFARWPRISYGFSKSLAQYLHHETSQFDLVHITSTFSFAALTAGRAARRAGVPYLVSPHGALQLWSLRQKRWKKVPYWVLFEKDHLMRAAALHATADLERDEALAVLPKANIFVVPNGMEPIGELGSVIRSPRQIVFLGRIHPKKGFDVLIPALSIVARKLPQVETIIAGPDQDGEWARVQTLIDRATPKPRVRYMGPVDGSERFRLLATSTVFVLPSHSENFGMTVVEAMATRTPVVISKNCPWQVVEQAGAGYWIENTPAAVADALLRILGDPAGASRMGEAGAHLAAQYDWSRIGQDMAAHYRRLLAHMV